MKIKNMCVAALLALGASAGLMSSATTAHAQGLQFHLSPKMVDVDFKDPQAFAMTTELLHQIYGRKAYQATPQCWMTEEVFMTNGQEETIRYCMKPLAVHILMKFDQANNPYADRFYIQMTGNVISSADQLNKTWENLQGSYHSELGAFGAFVVDVATEKVIAADYGSQYPKEFGRGPSEPLELVQLTDKHDFAWLGQGWLMYQGYRSTPPVLYVPQGREIKNIAGNMPGVEESNVNESYDYVVFPLTTKNGYHVMEITYTAPDGKTRTFEAAYNPQKGTYWCTDVACRQ